MPYEGISSIDNGRLYPNPNTRNSPGPDVSTKPEEILVYTRVGGGGGGGGHSAVDAITSLIPLTVIAIHRSALHLYNSNTTRYCEQQPVLKRKAIPLKAI